MLPLRSGLGVPLMREGTPIGMIILWRTQVRPFTVPHKQIELVTTFADQAAIAIENVRLFDEPPGRHSSSRPRPRRCCRSSPASPGELHPVFEAMLKNATRICEAKFGVLFRYDRGRFCVVAALDVPHGFTDFLLRDGGSVPPPDREPCSNACGGRSKRPTRPTAQRSQIHRRRRPWRARSTVAVPLLKEDELIGAIVIYRQEVRPFTDKQIELLKNFAAPGGHRHREHTPAQRAARIAAAADRHRRRAQGHQPLDLRSAGRARHAGRVRLSDFARRTGGHRRREGEHYSVAATFGFSPSSRDYIERYALQPDRGSSSGEPVEGRDGSHSGCRCRSGIRKRAAAARRLPHACRRTASARGSVVGVLMLMRTEPRPFTEKQIELLETFADQAVIAIENVRLFDDEQQRTRELTEALEQQTATSEVLRVISSSPGEMQPVFEAMLENAARICEANSASCSATEEDTLQRRGHVGVPIRVRRVRRGARSGSREPRCTRRRDRAIVHVPDVRPSRRYSTASRGTRRDRQRAVRPCSVFRCSRRTSAIGADRHLPPGGPAASPTSRSSW